jgi:hypothetical protein
MCRTDVRRTILLIFFQHASHINYIHAQFYTARGGQDGH